METTNPIWAGQSITLSAFFKPEFCNETTEKAVNKFGKILLSKFIEDFNNKKYASMDAHTGDNGCERIALSLYQLTASAEVKSAVDALKEKINENADKIELIEKIQYLVGCYFLRYIRKITFNKINGIEQFTVDLSKIENIPNKSPYFYKSAIVERIQAFVSKKSALFMQEASKQLSSDLKNSVKIQDACKIENLTCFVGKQDKCSFQKYKFDDFYLESLTIYTLKQLKAPILIKKMVNILGPAKKKEKSFGFLCQSSENNEEFKVLNSKKLYNGKIIVFEGTVKNNLNCEGLINKFNQFGITNVILCSVAKTEEKYAKDQEVLEYKELASKIECGKSPFFDLDHVYCSTIQEEINEGVTVYDDSN